MKEDLEEFFDPDTFATPATTASGACVLGIFDEEIRQILDVDTVGPAFTCAQHPAIRAGETLVIAGQSYRITQRITGDQRVNTWQLHAMT